MPLTGTIPITDGQSIVPCGSWFLKDADGKRYVVVGIGGIADFNIKVGCAETESTIFTRSEAEWQDDFNDLALSGVPSAAGYGARPDPDPWHRLFLCVR